MHFHIHMPTDAKIEFDSHDKIVSDMRTAVAEQKKVQKLVDLFMLGMFLAFLMYTTML